MEKKIVGIWIRVSTEDQARGESPEHHEKRARLYAEAKGWDVKTIYHLEAVSGKAVIQHAEAKRMLNDIKQGNITGLIFSKLARLARNTKELLDFSDFFRENNADLISLQEAIDTSTPAGRLFYTMIAAMAQWEREEIADRIKASVPIRAKMGKPLSGTAFFGYKWENREYVINEKEAPIRKLMFELFLKHKRKRTVAKELNDMGYRTRNGGKFTDTTIHRLLTDSAAKGMRISNYSKGKKKTLKPESEWVYVPCPAVVSEDLWNACNQILTDQHRKRRVKGPQAVHLLAGLVACTCGKKMYVYHANSAVYTCSNCKNRIPVETLDEIYHAQLKTFLLTDVDVKTYLSNSDEKILEKEKLLQGITEEANTIRKRKNVLVNLRMDGEMTKESFMEEFRPLEERLVQLQNSIPELQAEVDFLKIQIASSDVVLKEAKDLYDRWPTLPYENKRNIVETITDKITVGKEDVSLSLSYLPSFPQNPVKSQHGD